MIDILDPVELKKLQHDKNCTFWNDGVTSKTCDGCTKEILLFKKVIDMNKVAVK